MMKKKKKTEKRFEPNSNRNKSENLAQTHSIELELILWHLNKK